MQKTHEGLPILLFNNRSELRKWLQVNHMKSGPIWVEIKKTKHSDQSLTFHDLLEEGLCFGWSEAKRHPYDATSYLQYFGPRRKKGTTSKRNLELALKLIETGLMTAAGKDALNIKDK